MKFIITFIPVGDGPWECFELKAKDEGFALLEAIRQATLNGIPADEHQFRIEAA